MILLNCFYVDMGDVGGIGGVDKVRYAGYVEVTDESSMQLHISPCMDGSMDQHTYIQRNSWYPSSSSCGVDPGSQSCLLDPCR